MSLYSDNFGTKYILYPSKFYDEVCRYLQAEEEAERDLYAECDVLFPGRRNSL